MLADAGQKVITATLNKDPWNHQCLRCICRYDYLDEKQGWKLELRLHRFRQMGTIYGWIWVSITMINCYSLLTWNNQLHYNDEEKGELVTVELNTQSKEYAELVDPVLERISPGIFAAKDGWRKPI